MKRSCFLLPPARRIFAGAFCSVLLPLGAQSARAANFHSTWTGSGDGISWESDDNWNTAAYPQDGGGDFFHAYSEQTTGTRLIQTSGSLALRGLTITQGSGGVTTVKLGGDMALTDGTLANNSGVTNTSGSAAGVVFDLNKHHLITNNLSASRHNFGNASYTLSSSAAEGTGTFSVRNIASDANIAVQNNVTLRLTVNTTSYLDRVTWSAGSTLLIANTGNHTASADTAVAIGSLVVGEAANTSASAFVVNHSHLTVRGNVVLQGFTGALDGAASRINLNGLSAKLRVGGAFTDHGTGGSNYGTGTLAFTGGRTVEQAVAIGRAGLANAFEIGDGSAAGNIGLTTSLATTGAVTLGGDSRLNLNTFTLSANTFTAQEGATLALELGGRVNATGALSLNGFQLELLGDWSTWENGNDLVLFQYNTFSGTPLLQNIVAPEGFSYDGLFASGGLVYLGNVAIPEPGSVALLSAFGLGAVALRLRKRLATPRA